MGSICIFSKGRGEIIWAASWENQRFAFATTKKAEQLRGYREADHTFVFATWVVPYFYFLSPIFQASSPLLWLHNPVCVRRGRKLNCLFSHEASHMNLHMNEISMRVLSIGETTFFQWLFSAIPRWCLVTTRSSNLTFTMRPHWGFMSVLLRMIIEARSKNNWISKL